jgi:hypothetical protein
VRYLLTVPTVLILLSLAVLPALSHAGGFPQQDTTDPLQGDQLHEPSATTTNPKHLPDEDPTVRMQKELEKKANLERQLHLKTDTDKLFKLATELKDQVDKSNQNILSLEVIKKADEIEKLAHSVKEKMRGEN